jgi:predicted dinucleotide-utilizing enzyme
MRKLNTQDLFNFTKVMKAANLKEELQPLFLKGKDIKNNTDTNEDDIKQIGIEAILTVIEASGNAGVEDKVYKFLSGPFEMDEKSIAELSIEALFEKFEQLASENNISIFFKRAANLMKQK